MKCQKRNTNFFGGQFICVKNTDKLVSLGDPAFTTGDVYMQRMDVFTKTGALNIIEKVLGFPNPSPRFLPWYFTVDDRNRYVPKVNFQTLAKDIQKQEIIAEVEAVVGLSPSDSKKTKVLRRVQKMIENHKL